MRAGKLNLAALVTHIDDLNALMDTVLNLPSVPGDKKLIYNQTDMSLTAITDLEEKGKPNPLFAELERIRKAHNNLWRAEAERYLLANA